MGLTGEGCSSMLQDNALQAAANLNEETQIDSRWSISKRDKYVFPSV